MEEKYRELLDIHRSKFSDDVDAEVVLPILEREKVLDQNDVDVINQLTTNGDKVAKILDQLILKGNAAFESLCAALESTYPHLLTLMFLEKNERVNPGESYLMVPSSCRCCSDAIFRFGLDSTFN